MGRRRLGLVAAALVGVVGAVIPAAVAGAAAPTQQCSTSSVFTATFTTCIQVAAAPQGGSTLTATASSNVTVAKAQIDVTLPGGGTDVAGPGALPLSYSSGVGAAAPGQWCAQLQVTVPFFNTTLNGTAVCISVPPLPQPPGSPNQQCTQGRAPQFQTCIDVNPAAGGGSVVTAKGLDVINTPSAYLTVTGPNGFTASTTPAALAPGGQITYTSPTPAAAGQWCASLWVTFPALGIPINVTGTPPLCTTVT